MRPLLFHIAYDPAAAPAATMIVLFPGRPNRYCTLRIRTPVASLAEASRAAVRELDGFSPAELGLIDETARPIPMPHFGDVAPRMTIERVFSVARLAGPLHCPACCHPLGRGDSPAIGYLTRCGACGRGLTIRFAPGAMIVTLRVGAD